jgi:hypothetical protein
MQQPLRYSSRKEGSTPEVALGIAEAIEVSMTHAQLVTVPILDARLQELRAETRMALMNLESKLNASVQELKSEILHSRAELEAKFDRRFGDLDAKIDRRYGELETAMERIKAELIRWVFLVMLGNVALTAGATAVLNAFKHL